MYLHPQLSRDLALQLQRERVERAVRHRTLEHACSESAGRRPRRPGVWSLTVLLIAVALALPASADASTSTVVGSQLQITGSSGSNAVSISQLSDGRIVVADSREPDEIGPGCTTGQGGVLCSGANRIAVALGGGSDTLSTNLSLPTQYFGGADDDVLVTGTGPGASKVIFVGGPGRDTANYAAATRGVSVTKDGAANDGRTGDADNIEGDVEVLQGSRFADRLRGDTTGDLPGVLDGLAGDDLLQGGAGNDVFPTTPGDGADTIDGFVGFDSVDYRTRTRSVTITVDAGASDDGEVGERDDVRDMEQLLTGSGADTLVGSPFATRDGSFVSGAGVDRITGTERSDVITPGAGRDTVDARAGSDLVRTRDGEPDTIACGGGAGIDVLRADPGLDAPTTGCETVESVGVLRLSPAAAGTTLGVARVNVS